MTYPIKYTSTTLDNVCRCDGDDLIEGELDANDFEDDPCPRCGGRVILRRPPVWMMEEEDDC